MQKILYTSLVSLISISLLAQVAIGKESVSGSDTLLDFGSDNNKGLVLPWIATSDLDSNAPGTLYYDITEGKIMCTTSTADKIDLSVRGLDTAFDATNRGYSAYTENSTTTGVIIGASETSKRGVLVIEPLASDSEKAIILPKVTDYQNIGAPEAGTVVYDETIKTICLFDGERWTFWGKRN